jgi:hypothetical protein
MKWLICILFTLVLTGCGIVMQDDFTPAKYSDDMIKYAYKTENINDANTVPKRYAGWWKSKTELDELTVKMKVEHDKTQADLEYQKTRDLGVYVVLAQKADIYQKEAIETGSRLFGTSGLFTIGIGTLLTLFGGGLGSTMTALYKNSTQYNETEVNQIKENITAIFDKERWTDAEVANEVAARVLSICQTLGITDMAKIQDIINTEKAKAIAEV